MIDSRKFFMPERLTPLYHVDGYRHLSAEQRLRYNQLQACYLNEQTIFFESVMAQPILRSFLSRKIPPAVRDDVRQFIAEEAGHSQMFRELNRACRPDWYREDDFRLIKVSRIAAFGLSHWVRQAAYFPFFLWLLLLQEERALFYAREFLRDADRLEPSFVATQRRHLADEVGHIRWDEALLKFVWPETSPRWRKLNARLLTWMVGEYFIVPRRSGLRVLAELVGEFPSLATQAPTWRTQMRQLGENPEFQRLAYSREATPRAFAGFDAWPEFHPISRVLQAYRPAPGTAVSRARELEAVSAADK